MAVICESRFNPQPYTYEDFLTLRLPLALGSAEAIAHNLKRDVLFTRKLLAEFNMYQSFLSAEWHNFCDDSLLRKL